MIQVNDKFFVIPPNAPDPFVNTVNVHATRSPEGFPNVLDDSASF